MKKIFTILLCGIFVFGLTGCGSSEEENKIKIGNESDLVISNDAGITLSVKEDTLTKTGATFVIKNDSDSLYSYGNADELEIKQDGKWHKIDLTFDITLPSYSVLPGEVKELEFNWENTYGKLPKGTYRLVKPFSKDGNIDMRIYLAAEFTI